MLLERILELLKIERTCVLRNSKNSCDRVCVSCDLVQTDSDLLEMYDTLIAMFGRFIEDGVLQYTTDDFFEKICFIKNNDKYDPVGVITAVDLTNPKQFEFGVTPFDQILAKKDTE